MIRALAEWLVTQPGLTDLKVGSTVVIWPVTKAELDARADRLVVLIERPGASGTMGEIDQSRLQVIVRHKTRDDARDLAWAVHRALHENYGRAWQMRSAADQVTGELTTWAILGDEPAPIGVDPRGRYEFAANYTLARSRTA